MATIGSVVLRLEAQHQQLTQGLSEGTRSIHSFGEAANGMGSKLAEGFGIGAGIELAKAGIEAVTDAVRESITVVTEWISTSLQAANATLRTAEALHLHTETLGGLEVAGKHAGLAQEQMTMALEKLNAKIGEVASKGDEAGNVFAKLGLKASTLAGQGLDTSIRQIADSFAKISNPAERAALAAELFGERAGPRLAGLLSQGSAGIEEAIKQAKEMGVSFNDLDTGKLAASQRAFDEIGEHIEGAKNQLTIALAPALLAITKSILSVIPPADKMREAFTDAFTFAVTLGAAVWDQLNKIEAAATRVAASFLRIVDVKGLITGKPNETAALLDAAADQMDKSHAGDSATKWLIRIQNDADKAGKEVAKKLTDPPGKVTPDTSKIEEVFKHLKEQAATVGNARPKELFELQNLHASTEQLETAKKLIDEINQKKIHLEVDKSLEEMAKQVATFGMDEGKKKLFDLESMGASKDQIELAKMYSDQLEKLEARKKEVAEATELTKKITDSNPITKYQDELKKLDKLHNDGLISAQTYAAGVADANKDLMKSASELDKAKDKKVGAETRRFDFTGPRENKKTDPILELTRVQRDAAKDVAKSRDYLAEIYRYQMNQDNDADITVDWTGGA